MLKNSPQNDMKETYPLALTIAGSATGGGAGIQADLRTFSSFGVFGTSVITAITAQNHSEIMGIEAVSSEILNLQLKAVFSKLAVKTVKIGMIPNLESAEIIIDTLKNTSRAIEVIIDPVMISSSGKSLMIDGTLKYIKKNLFPIADWLTPNIQEAETILNRKLPDKQSIINASIELSEIYDCISIVKGGDSPSESADDFLTVKKATYNLSSDRIKTPLFGTSSFSHGTGCTFSSAIAACRSLDMHWKDSVISAKAFVLGSLNETVKIGNNITAMYPPAASYRNKIKIKKI
jgi:hydroxymethylpyrimidine/phosphomethylpyrimidine kinase